MLAALAAVVLISVIVVERHTLAESLHVGRGRQHRNYTGGGFALVELALTAALTAAGLQRSSALAAVLAYRLVNFWLILIAGWVLMAVLAHRRIGPPNSDG